MNDERSPYTTPEAEIEAPPVEGVELAGRGARLGGAIIDGLLLMIVYIPVIFFTGILASLSNPVTDVTTTLLALLAGFGSFLLVHGYLLATSGQTVAKRMLGMQIVSVKDNRTLPFGKLIGLRYLPLYAVGLIPVIGSLIGLVNPLTIFGGERRCLHDYIAGTKVIKVSETTEP